MADAVLETIWARLVASRCCPTGMMDDKPEIYADHKWFTRLAVVAAVDQALRGLDLHYPAVPPEQMGALEEARRTLAGE